MFYEADIANCGVHHRWGPDKIDRMSILITNPTVWSMLCFMRLFYAANPPCQWSKLLSWSLGDVPPIDGMDSWADCLVGRLNLQFGVELPVSRQYETTLARHMQRDHPIGIIRRWMSVRDGQPVMPESSTAFRVMLTNLDNGFAAIFLPLIMADILDDSPADPYRSEWSTAVNSLVEQYSDDAPPGIVILNNSLAMVAKSNSYPL